MRMQSSFLVKRESGRIQFSAEKYNLTSQNAFKYQGIANDTGAVRYTGELPEGACGQAVQILDLDACTTSRVRNFPTPVVDTIKQVDGQRRIVHTPPRAELWAAQTPQGSPVDQLRQAHQRALQEGWEVTDDAALFERLGWPVRVLEATGANLKITTPLDLELAAALLRQR